MSASSKKKLRNQEASAKLTERQMNEQKEAKKLRLYTIAFVVCLVVLIVTAAAIGISRTIKNSGLRERNTIAATVGSHEISNAELSYFYIDSVNNFYSQNRDYIGFFGLQTGTPLNEQEFNAETGETWADYFLSNALQSAKTTYAVTDEAKANGYELSEDAKNQIDDTFDMLGLYANIYGYKNADTYLRAMYGNGANTASYRNYLELSTLAGEYAQAYQDGLSFSAEEIEQEANDHPGQYDSYRYHQYFLSVSAFEGDNAQEQAKQAADSLIADTVVTAEDFDSAIANLPMNAGVENAASTESGASSLNGANGYLQDWLSAPSTKPGDKTVAAVSSTSTAEDGSEVTTVTGYYAAFLDEKTENSTHLVNVRHILVEFEGGSEENGVTVYSDAEKNAAKAKAEELLSQWKSGEATEESFAALAAENSTDAGSNENGGLYENVYPGQMVANFNDWCFDSQRSAGETGIIETNFGYHVVFFSGVCDDTYRDYLIKTNLTNEKVNDWYTNLVDSMTLVDGDTSYMRLDLALNG